MVDNIYSYIAYGHLKIACPEFEQQMIFHGDSLVILEILFFANQDLNPFDGYRFVDPTTGACDISSTVTATEKWLSFAIGASTCPGRLAGTRITQVMFAKILYG